MRWRSPFLVASSLLCASCGPISKLPPLASEEIEAEQRKQQVDHIRDYLPNAGVLTMSHSASGSPITATDNRSTQIGLDAGTVPSLPRKFRSHSHDALSVSWTRATVLSVAETSPAAAGGIKPGDQLLTFNNEAVPAQIRLSGSVVLCATMATDQSGCWCAATASMKSARSPRCGLRHSG